MRCPQTLQRINTEMRRRHEAGQSTDLVDMESQPMVDADIGVFLRCTMHFADGGVFTFDTAELSAELRAAFQRTGMQ